jgi:hypothetical protein
LIQLFGTIDFPISREVKQANENSEKIASELRPVYLSENPGYKTLFKNNSPADTKVITGNSFDIEPYTNIKFNTNKTIIII